MKQKWLAVASVIAVVSGMILFFNLKNNGNIRPVMAGTGHNVSGFAWSPHIGWISFNSTDCDTDGDGTYEGGGESGGAAPSGCPASGAVQDYGVAINKTTGDFSGWAWSPNVGWIDFGPTSGYPSPPNSPASYNSGNGNVTGWAKILSMGDDGWIKLRKQGSDGGSDYGVSIDSGTGEFSGWAWNANDTGAGIGWISFNCGNAEAPDCTNNYKVVTQLNSPPAVSNLTAPNWSYQQAADYRNARRAFLQWDYYDPESTPQDAYHVVFDDNSDFSSPLKDTGQTTGSAQSVLIDQSAGVNLSYDSVYYWKVKVWDGGNASSSWATHSFTTYKHEMPAPGFSWFPAKPSKGEDVKLTDGSQIYLSGAPTAPVACDDAKCDWLWTVPPGTSINNDATSSPIINFSAEGSHNVILTITDADGYAVSTTTVITVGSALPKWKEVK